MSKHPWIVEFGKKNRYPVFIAFIGQPGTGKSSAMKLFLPINKRNIICPANMFDASETWPGYRTIKPLHQHEQDIYDARGKKTNLYFYIPEIKNFTGTALVDISVFRSGDHKQSFFQTIVDTNRPEMAFTDGALFIDDARNYITGKGNLPQRLITFFSARRHAMLDIFLAYHAFSDVNAELIQYGLKFILFKTNLPPTDAVYDKIINRDQMDDAIAYINNHPDPHYYEFFDPTNRAANDWTKAHRK